MKTRLQAAKILFGVLQGSSLDELLKTVNFVDTRDQAFVKAIVFGTCRHFFSLNARLNQLLKNPEKLANSNIHALLLIGLFQLKYMRSPSYAVVSETVNAAKVLQKKWGSGLVNGVLRAYLRDQDLAPNKKENVNDDHPKWWRELLKESWPLHYENMMAADLKHPPLTIRINKRKTSREEYLSLCEKAEIECCPCQFSKDGIKILTPLNVTELPFFNEGFFSVQDEAAQLAASLLTPKKNDIVLDACSAPGGKLTHLLEEYPDLNVVAIEKDKNRSLTILENLTRLNLKAQVLVHDVNDARKILSHEFDHILLDVPCSASGVVRRHPDIKLLRKQSDLERLAKEQHQLLTNIFSLLKPNGTLLYATCSVFVEENDKVISRFLAENDKAKIQMIEAPWGIATQFGRQILPGMDDMDGFYYAKLKRME